MIFQASAEVFQPAFPALDKVRRRVHAFMNFAFSESELNSLDCTLRYIPIVMPDHMKPRYSSRSRIRKKERIYDCAPQLNYEIFLTDSFEDQIDEYLGGLTPSASYLAPLGASPEQIDAFIKILGSARDQILKQDFTDARIE